MQKANNIKSKLLVTGHQGIKDDKEADKCLINRSYLDETMALTSLVAVANIIAA